MAPVSTSAVLLRSHDYGDTSRILRFYTEAHGVLSVIARGVRTRSGKGTTALATFATGTLTAFMKPGIFWWWPAWTEIHVQEVVRQTLNLPPQSLMTEDRKDIAVSGIVVYEIHRNHLDFRIRLIHATVWYSLRTESCPNRNHFAFQSRSGLL